MSTYYNFNFGVGSQIVDIDLLYEQYFGKVDNGSFVEVGAFDGWNWSNTYPLTKLGWRGLLFEPQPDYAQKCRDLHKGNPKIAVSQAAVGSHNGMTRLYLGGSISTTMRRMVDIYNSIDWSQSCGLRKDRYITVPLLTLNYALNLHEFPHDFELLVIDVEGAELNVLKGLNLNKWHPRMLIIEAHEDYPDEKLNWKAKFIEQVLCPHGYTKIYHDYINTIYWKE